MIYTPFTNERIVTFSDSTSSASPQDDLIATTGRDCLVYVQKARHETTGAFTATAEVYLNEVKNGDDQEIATGFSSSSDYNYYYGFQVFSCPANTQIRVAWERGSGGGTSDIEVQVVIAERN